MPPRVNNEELLEALDDLTKSFEKVNVLLDQLQSNTNKTAHGRLVTQITKELQGSKQLMQQFDYALLEIKASKPSEAAKYAKTPAANKQRFEHLNGRLQQLKTFHDDDIATAGPSSRPGSRGGSRPTTPNPEEELTEAEIAAIAMGLTQASANSLKRAQALALNAEEIATHINTKLQEQTDQMARIAGDIQTVSANAIRGERQIRAFMRRAATDKCVLLMILLILIVIILIIYYKATGGKAVSTTIDDLTVSTKF